MPSATFTAAGSSSSSSSNQDMTSNGDSADVVLLVFAYVVPCIFTIGLLLYLFYCCDSKSKKIGDDENDNDTENNNARGLPNEETSLLPTTTKDHIPPATKAPDVEEGVSKPPPPLAPTTNSSGIGSFLPQFMLPTPTEKPTTEKVPTSTTAAADNNKDPTLLTPTLDNITKTLPKAIPTNAAAPTKPPKTTFPTDNNVKENGSGGDDVPNKPSSSSSTSFPSLYFNPMDLMNGGGVPPSTTTDGTNAPAKIPVQFVIPPEGNKATPSTSTTTPVVMGLPTVPTSIPVENGNGAKDSKEPSTSTSAFPSLYFNPMDLMPVGTVPITTSPEGTTTAPAQAPASTSSLPSTSLPAPETTNGTNLLPTMPSMPSMGNLLNPMDLLGSLNPVNMTTTPVAGPPSGPPVIEGVARDLVDRNNPVLFEIYLFYSFHAGINLFSSPTIPLLFVSCLLNIMIGAHVFEYHDIPFSMIHIFPCYTLFH